MAGPHAEILEKGFLSSKSQSSGGDQHLKEVLAMSGIMLMFFIIQIMMRSINSARQASQER